MNVQVLASGSTANCYQVSDGYTNLLIECGLPIRRIQEGLSYRLSSIDACLVSHEHQDHSRAVEDIAHAGIDVYMSQGTLDALGIAKTHRIHTVTAGQQFEIRTFIIRPFEVQHDAAEPLGFLLLSKWSCEKLLYATDTHCLRYRFVGLNYIMVECNYSLDILQENIASGAVPPGLRNRILKSHFSLEHVKRFLEANDLSRVQEIWLLHLSDGNSDAERFKREIQKLTGVPVYIA